MNWTIFYLTFAIAFLASSPAFAALNALGVRLGQVPAPGTNVWHGRPFVHWREETTLFVADPFFLSLLDALVVNAALQTEWTIVNIIWAAAVLPLPVMSTIWWLRSVPKANRAGTMKTWGWHWTGPDARTTIAGYWHAIYFLLQSMIGILALGFFLGQEDVSIHLKAGMFFCACGYFASFFHHTNMEKTRGHV